VERDGRLDVATVSSGEGKMKIKKFLYDDEVIAY
jgi:hypothetical protein